MPEYEALSDLGNAHRLVKKFGETIRYCHGRRQWFIWDGYRWVPDEMERIVGLAKLTLGTIQAEAKRHTKVEDMMKVLRHLKESESASHIRSMVELAKSDEKVSLCVDDLDSDPWFFNCINGTIDLRTGELLDHDKSRIITKIAPFEYDASADGKHWEQFLATVIPEPDVREFLQCAVGYSLTTDMREECMFFLHGAGQNGKTTFINTILAMTGDYGAQTSAETWLKKRNEGPRNDLIRLAGKRFVSAAETDMDEAFDEGLLKQVTGGDRITVNPKYRDEIEFTPTWKIWLSANHRPQIKETEMAIWRRIRLIPFTVAIDKRDPLVKLNLTTRPLQWAAVFNWALEGCLKWQAHEVLHVPGTIQAAVNLYRREQDVVGQFIDDCCLYSENARIPQGELYRAFDLYARAGGEHKIPRIIRFGNELVRRSGDKLDRRKYRGIWHWFGVKLSEKISINPEDYREQDQT